MRKALSWCWAWTFRRRPRRSPALWPPRQPTLWPPPRTSLRTPGRKLCSECWVLKNLLLFTFCTFNMPNYCLDLVILLHPYTREIFPEGLPPSYVFVATLRLKGSSSKLTFDLWRVLSKDKEIQAAVTLSGKDKTVMFTTTSATTGNEQRVSFKTGFEVGIRIDFHVQISFSNMQGRATYVIGCSLIQSKPKWMTYCKCVLNKNMHLNHVRVQLHSWELRFFLWLLKFQNICIKPSG